jgi:hypothetical protein
VPPVEETPDPPDLSANDPGDIPDSLRRCDHCGQLGMGADPLNPWDWPGRPDGIRLHSKCEEAWQAAVTEVARP